MFRSAQNVRKGSEEAWAWKRPRRGSPAPKNTEKARDQKAEKKNRKARAQKRLEEAQKPKKGSEEASGFPRLKKDQTKKQNKTRPKPAQNSGPEPYTISMNPESANHAPSSPCRGRCAPSAGSQGQGHLPARAWALGGFSLRLGFRISGFGGLVLGVLLALSREIREYHPCIMLIEYVPSFRTNPQYGVCISGVQGVEFGV